MIPEPSVRMCVSRGLGDDHFKRMSRVTVGVARLTPNVQWPGMPSIGQNLQPTTGFGGVSLLKTNSQVGR